MAEVTTCFYCQRQITNFGTILWNVTDPLPGEDATRCVLAPDMAHSNVEEKPAPSHTAVFQHSRNS